MRVISIGDLQIAAPSVGLNDSYGQVVNSWGNTKPNWHLYREREKGSAIKMLWLLNELKVMTKETVKEAIDVIDDVAFNPNDKYKTSH